MPPCPVQYESDGRPVHAALRHPVEEVPPAVMKWNPGSLLVQGAVAQREEEASVKK